MTDSETALRNALGDRYSLEGEIGHGGMARVYLATDRRHDRKVAIKVIHPDVAWAVSERFLQEIQIEAKLQHPLILPLHDSGEGEGVLYYVMPYVEGESLADRLEREKQLPVEQAVRIARDVAEALEHAHSRGVVHRDIKPSNILLSSEHAVVADFGIARALTAAGSGRLTEAGITLGTPPYMSPEQAGGGELDGRSDLYSLGCVLFEMLVGSPPFTGSTGQAILARHINEPPPLVGTTRPAVPVWLEDVVQTLLAKVAADRFATAHDVALGLDAGLSGRYRRRIRARRWSRRLMVGALAIGGVALGVWGAVELLNRGKPLDRNRVVVFPLRETGSNVPAGHGEEVATVVGYALEGTQPLKWLEGFQWLPADQRDDPARVPYAEKRRISRERNAAYFIDGSIVADAASIGVLLRLNDVAGDSVVAQARAAGAPDVTLLGQLGVRAVTRLLPALVAPQRTTELSKLAEGDPAAVANWLQGERAYRRSDFKAALDHFERALARDSTLALAAFGAANAAGWLYRLGDARGFGEVALAHEDRLPPRHRALARGLRHYYLGAADSALSHVYAALALDPEWSEGWMVLGEVYHHLLPTGRQLDSVFEVLGRPVDLDTRWYEAWMSFRESYIQLLPVPLRNAAISFDARAAAEAALIVASELDPDFAPPLDHLAEFALQRGDVRRAEELLERLSSPEPDATEMMLPCQRDGPGAVPWRAAADSLPFDVLGAGVLLATGMAAPECAESAFRAVIVSERAGMSERWGAVLGLMSVLTASARYEDLSTLLESDAVAPSFGPNLFILAAAMGAPFAQQASAAASSLGVEYERLSEPVLWLLGEWAAREGRAADVARIARALQARADSTGARRAGLLAAIMTAQARLTAGDSLAALEALSRLTPSAPRDEVLWQPWESLAPERLALAELYLARGEHERALAVAALLDDPQPVVYLVYLPASLRIRARAAEAMGDVRLAEHYRARLSAFRPEVRSP